MSKVPVVTIDTGVPIPEKVSYPLKDLEVGESFVFPANKRSSVSARASRITGKEFTIKKQDEATCRVWRTA